MAEDLEVLHEIATFMEKHSKVGQRHRLVRVVEEFQRTLLQEMDYQREASNLKLIAANLREFPHIQIPLPVDSYTTRSVLNWRSGSA